jgi:hypothetical protein
MLIEIKPGVTRYMLPENALKVLQAYYRNVKKEPLNGEDQFIEVPIDDINHPESIFVAEPNALHIPNPEDGRLYSIIMVVYPPLLTEDNIDTVDIFFPPQYIDAFVSYVAYRAYKSIDGDERTEIGTHWRMYQNACKELYKKGLVHTTAMTNLKAIERGFA